MKIVISIYKTNPDSSNGLYTVSHNKANANFEIGSIEFKHYGWKHEFPDEDKLKQAIELIFESVKQT